MKYQKLMALVWIWALFVLTQSYAGNLTAILMKPKLEKPIRTLEGLLNQEKMPWVVQEGGHDDFFLKSFPSGSLLKQLHDTNICWEYLQK